MRNCEMQTLAVNGPYTRAIAVRNAVPSVTEGRHGSHESDSRRAFLTVTRAASVVHGLLGAGALCSKAAEVSRAAYHGDAPQQEQGPSKSQSGDGGDRRAMVLFYRSLGRLSKAIMARLWPVNIPGRC